MSEEPADVNEQAVENWIAETTPAERVQSVMRRTYDPKPVREIAEHARVEDSIAREHLHTLHADGFVARREGSAAAGTRYVRSEHSRSVEAFLMELQYLTDVDVESVLERHAEVAKLAGVSGERLRLALRYSNTRRMMTMSEEKARVYRDYQRGEATMDDVHEVFGDDIGEFERFIGMMDIVRESTTNEVSNDLHEQGEDDD